MSDSGPFDRRGVAFTAALLLTVAVWLVLSVANAPLRTAAAPLGIISLELAGTAEHAATILASWGAPQREAAAFGLGLDFLFLFLYPITISLACRIVAARVATSWPRWSLIGMAIALAVPACVVLDAIENAALWRVLAVGPAAPWPSVAAVAAYPKFALVAIGIGYALVTWPLGRRGAA
jgi:hypothetical protein